MEGRAVTNDESKRIPDLAAIRAAAERIRPHAHRTPVVSSATLNQWLGAEIFFKCDNFQKAGAFKFRGACNAVFSLSEEAAARGVLTHSSGNHAAALALAAQRRGIDAFLVMPNNAPAVKQAAVSGYGGKIFFCEPTVAAREAMAEEVRSETGAAFIHPYNDPRIIAGQGTAALELLEEVPALDLIVAPVGGGGLLSGTALAVSALAQQTTVLGAEPVGADDARRSLHEGRIVPAVDPQTIADGLRTSLGDLTFAVIRKHVAEIVTVDDEATVRAMRFVWERMKIVVEPSAAVPVAALLDAKVEEAGKRVGVILSGGNVDLDRLPWLPTEQGLGGRHGAAREGEFS
jgi:threonine dehydratase